MGADLCYNGNVMFLPPAIAGAFPKRPPYLHKRSAGVVTVVGGSAHFVHAPVIAGIGARAAGAGLIQLVVPDASRIAAGALLPEATFFKRTPTCVPPKADVTAIGMGLGVSEPLEVKAEYTVESSELMRQFWPRNSHVTWKMPGVAATGGKPFGIEWCDGSIVARDAMAKGDKDAFSAKSMKIDGSGVKASMDPKYFPPAFFAELFAKTAIGKQPLEGRVVEGTEGWLLSVHCHASPAVVLKSGRVVAPPAVGPAPSHWHEYVNCCLDGGTPTSSFAWAGRLSEMVIRGNEAMVIPG